MIYGNLRFGNLVGKWSDSQEGQGRGFGHAQGFGKSGQAHERFSRGGLRLSVERGSDSFKKAFEVGGPNSRLHKKNVKVGQPPSQ